LFPAPVSPYVEAAMPAPLGKLSRVDPRSVWRHEAHDFTPWLAEHIDMLAEVLGLDVEVVTREGAVGDFSVDIVANDLGRRRKVVIENQLEATDHAHLGQLVTYAAGLEASVVVWVSPEFRDEHRQALDWLNRAGSGTEYFGVVLELLRVDESKPAVNFRLVASPNNWTRLPRGGGTQELSSKSAAYKEFFQKLIDELREKYNFTNARAGQPQNWYSFSSGIRGFSYGASFAAKGRLRCELYIDLGHDEANEKALELLKKASVEVEGLFQEKLSWEDLDTKRACRVACYRPGTIEDSDESLESHLKWTVDKLLLFKKAFGQRLAGVASAAAPARDVATSNSQDGAGLGETR
jgi:Domain of unknown function (DUF4268)